MFVKITNGQVEKYPYSLGHLRKDHPNVSFPRSMSDEVLASYGVFRVTEMPAPDFSPRTHKLVAQAPSLVNGTWVVTQLPVAKTQTEIDNDDAVMASQVRVDRDSRLAETDWRVIKHLELNENIPGVWEVYRQALRDVPAQAGFPWEVNWPVEPK